MQYFTLHYGVASIYRSIYCASFSVTTHNDLLLTQRLASQGYMLKELHQILTFWIMTDSGVIHS